MDVLLLTSTQIPKLRFVDTHLLLQICKNRNIYLCVHCKKVSI
jgi:hypothetical protein